MFPPAYFFSKRPLRSLYASRTNTEKQIELPLPVSRGHVDGFAALQKCDILSARVSKPVSWEILVASLTVASPFEDPFAASSGCGQE
jgi:hypothetical protein